MPRSVRDSAEEREGWCEGCTKERETRRSAKNGGNEEKETSRGCVESRQGLRGMVPRNEGEGAERARKDAKEQESATEKRRGNCKIRHRKSAEITICTQSYNIIDTFSTYLYTSIVLFLGALTHGSHFDSCLK